METIFRIFLIIHITGGAVGLLTGILNMIAKKGDSRHKIVGKIFFFSMLTAGLSSLVLSTINPSLFLFMVGIFTVYMVATGYSYLHLKMLNINQKPKIIDWILTIVMMLAAFLFIGIGIMSLLKSNLFGLVFITFGTIGLLFVRHDFKNYSGKSHLLNYWLSEHLQRMIGAFIASTTAFLVVNAKYLPESIPNFVYWLLPTLIFTPLIIKWANKYEVKK
ncbi:MAG: DUF2306 domain-containing protein [Bacteroidota bacterium]|nr:DUF2306 domain-containing protein [Bacteroidota bacterium]